MRRFITAHDVEVVSFTGRSVLYIDEDDVVLAVAREMAGKLGVRIEKRGKDETTPAPQPPEPSRSPAAPFVPAEFLERPAQKQQAASDIVLRNGTVVWPGQGTLRADISIAQGKIASIQSSCPTGSARELDISGKYVIPGVIDPHVHLGIFNSLETDLQVETKAALWGGVTTIGCFRYEQDSYLPKLDAFIETVEKHSSVDLILHLTLSTEQHLEEIPRYVEEYGLRSFKIYMSGVPGIIPDVDDSFMRRVYEKLRGTGKRSTVCIHAENPCLVRWATEVIRGQNGKTTSVQEWSETHPPLAEEEAIRRAGFLTKEFDGVSTYFVHVSTKGGIEAVSQMKCGADNLYAETTSPYLLFTIEDVRGNIPKWLPPLRDRASREALWSMLERGKIDTLGTDSVPMSEEIKGLDKSVWEAMPNAPLMEHHLPGLLTEGVARRKLPMDGLIDRMTRRPAEIFAAYPRKGSLFPGTDADLVVVDLKRWQKVDKERLRSGSSFSLFEGQELTGWPSVVIKGGKMVIQDGEWVDEPGPGCLLSVDPKSDG
jgi:dihydropyrimidinase